ncbi:acyl-CoA thioesterase [Teredinibacter turnerae]|uniref:acyl-CoA thioesterase n=1 Tax=Teredinibacter turnerae TaxID=2426 RepID=UPI00038024A4|nr:acyl-CoA thioesterase II [Teredinibacter turnerae]
MATSIGQFLQLEKLDTNLFRNIHHRENFMGTLFGGQVLAQALMACTKTIDDPNLLPHSLHAYFLRAGKSADPVIYDVEMVRDGQSIRSRRAVARQYGKPIFNMSASFHQLEEGYHHQEAMPEGIASPEELLKTANPIVHDHHIPPSDNRAGAFNPLEILPLDGVSCDTTEVRAPRAMFWMRAKERLSDECIEHYCTLAFASDLGLLATTLLPHNTSLFTGEIIAASIDHAMWFHSREFRADDWLLCTTYSPWAGNARGFAHGSIFTRDGRLILSTCQEGLIRPNHQPAA